MARDLTANASLARVALINQTEYSAGNLIYLGEAVPGTATSEAKWRIAYLTYNASVFATRTYANQGAFDQIWDNRASLTYT